MDKDTHKTKVIFRVWTRKDFAGDVIAFFPEYLGTVNKPNTCESYMHVGQHGAADYRGLLSETRPAQASEYAGLKKELESIGYDLVIAQRETHADYLKRIAQMH